MERPLTAKGQATRDRIVEGAAALVRARGVADTTLEDVCIETRTSKSQLFHYFPAGRSQLLVAIAHHQADAVLADQQPHLDDLTSWRRWEDWRDQVVDRYRVQGPSCPLGVLVSQLDPGEPAIRAVEAGLLDQWQQRITRGIRSMQSQRKVAARLDADRCATALLAGIQGGVVAMLATGETTHLAVAMDTAIEALRFSLD